MPTLNVFVAMSTQWRVGNNGATGLDYAALPVVEDRVGIAGVLAVAAVHTHLVRRGLRSYASINVRTAECLDTHYYAVLIGVGATTVNAYLAEAAIADRQSRGLFGDIALTECLRRHRVAVEEGLLKIMSKMGIAVISSYRGGYNFEAVGLSRSLVNDLFPGMPAKISGGYSLKDRTFSATSISSGEPVNITLALSSA